MSSQPAIGLDPGQRYGGVRCTLGPDGEILAPVESQGGQLLPAVVLPADRVGGILESRFPLLPLGTGAPWPPEAQVSREHGARRIPLALGWALLETGRPDQAWRWPSFVRGKGAQSERERLSRLLREALRAKSAELSSPVALPVPAGLPLQTQTDLSTRAGVESGARGPQVRLLWRSVAALLAGLGPWKADAQSGNKGLRQPGKVLHVHAGVDGFEATLLSVREHKGDHGPRLMVPARQRTAATNHCSAPFLGLQLLGAKSRQQGARSASQLWEAAFATADVPYLPDMSEPEPDGDADPVWGQAWDTPRFADWDQSLGQVIKEAASLSQGHVVLTGEHAAFISGASPVGHVGLQRTRAALRDLRWPIIALGPSAIAEGSALFLSRRIRGWATYLDQLPAVELVVLKGEEPAWIHAIEEETFHDAGKPAVSNHERWGKLSPGALKLLLPALVEGFGKVRKSSIEFEQALVGEHSVDLSIEVEAASGLPVIRAILPGLGGIAAELDWAQSEETPYDKDEYLQTIPRQFPPVEERSEAKWWVSGADQTKLKFGSAWLTCDEACARIADGKPTAAFVALLSSLGTSANRRRLAGFGERVYFECSTDSNGRNRWATHLPHAQAAVVQWLAKAEQGDELWKACLRFLAYSRHSAAALSRRLIGDELDLRACKESDPLLAAAGNCLESTEHMGVALRTLSRRIDESVDEAHLKGVVPKGIYTLKAISTLMATRPEASKDLDPETSRRLSEGISRFLELSVRYADRDNGLHQKFRAAMKALVFLLRRRAYEPSYFGAGTKAFNRSIKSCLIGGLISELQNPGMDLPSAKRSLAHKLGLERDGASTASRATREILMDLKMTDLPLPRPNVGDQPALEKLVAQVVLYIEGRGSGIIVIDED